MTQTTNALDTSKNAGIQSIASSFAVVALPSLLAPALIALGFAPHNAVLTQVAAGAACFAGNFAVAAVKNDPAYSYPVSRAGIGMLAAVPASLLYPANNIVTTATSACLAMLVDRIVISGSDRKALETGLGALVGGFALVASIHHFVPDAYKEVAKPEAPKKASGTVIQGEQAQKCKEIGYDAQNNTLTIPQGCNLALAR